MRLTGLCSRSHLTPEQQAIRQISNAVTMCTLSTFKSFRRLGTESSDKSLKVAFRISHFLVTQPAHWEVGYILITIKNNFSGEFIMTAFLSTSICAFVPKLKWLVTDFPPRLARSGHVGFVDKEALGQVSHVLHPPPPAPLQPINIFWSRPILSLQKFTKI